jgi:hypothetical protein
LSVSCPQLSVPCFQCWRVLLCRTRASECSHSPRLSSQQTHMRR